MDIRGLKQYEKYFYRAPSAHNAQPWVLDYQEDVIFLKFDQSRSLPHSDPTHRDLLLSLGAFAETVLIVAAHFGHSLSFIPDIDINDCSIGLFQKATELYKTGFVLNDVLKRQTSRLVYDQRGLDQETIDDLGRQSSDFRALLLPSTSIIDLYKIADEDGFRKIPVVKELRDWFRLSKKDPRYFRDGLTPESLNLNHFEALSFVCILRLLESHLGQWMHLDKVLTYFSVDAVQKKSDVLVLVGHDQGNGAVLEAGRVLQRMWLALARRGYFTQPFSQIVDCPEAYRILFSRLHLKEGERIFEIFRAGRSPQPARSYRLVECQ